MNGTQALAEIHRAANGNRVSISGHALKRMSQRGATYRDVVNALRTAKSARWQEEHQTWLAEGGIDTDATTCRSRASSKTACWW